MSKLLSLSGLAVFGLLLVAPAAEAQGSAPIPSTDGVTRLARSPVAGVGIPAVVAGGGYVWHRRRARQ